MLANAAGSVSGTVTPGSGAADSAATSASTPARATASMANNSAAPPRREPSPPPMPPTLNCLEDHVPTVGPPSTLPLRITRRIQNLEYVDIAELLPANYRFQELREDPCCSHSHRPLSRRALVTDILVWVEGYSQMVAVLAPLYPGYFHEFMAYLQIIVRASRNYEGTAGASYDVAFRRQAAAIRDLHWGRVDSTLYNEAFAGRARMIPRCRYCLGESHSSEECSYAPAQPTLLQLPASFLSPQQGRLPGGNRHSPTVEICQRFNRPDGNKCFLKPCKYAHLCSNCHRPHPASDCGPASHDTGPGKCGRSRSPRRRT